MAGSARHNYQQVSDQLAEAVRALQAVRSALHIAQGDIARRDATIRELRNALGAAEREARRQHARAQAAEAQAAEDPAELQPGASPLDNLAAWQASQLQPFGRR